MKFTLVCVCYCVEYDTIPQARRLSITDMPELNVVNADGETKGASGKPKKEKPTKAPKNHEDKLEVEDETDSLLQAVVTQQLGSGVRYRKKAAAKKHAAKRKSRKLQICDHP